MLDIKEILDGKTHDTKRILEKAESILYNCNREKLTEIIEIIESNDMNAEKNNI